MDKKTFKKGVGFLAKAFPKREFDAGFLWHFWQDLNDNKFMQAVNELCTGHQELYPDSNIVAIVLDMAQSQDRLSPEEAWGVVKKQLQTYNGYNHPNFGDPLISQAVDCVGWRVLTDAEDNSYNRSFFMAAYKNIVKRDDREQRLAIAEKTDKPQIAEKPATQEQRTNTFGDTGIR